MTPPLPKWADNAHCRAILVDILAREPDCWLIRRHAWDNCRYPRFKGADAADLRRYWEVQCDMALRSNNGTLFHELQQEIPDDLIERMLRATPEELAA